MTKGDYTSSLLAEDQKAVAKSANLRTMSNNLKKSVSAKERSSSIRSDISMTPSELGGEVKDKDMIPEYRDIEFNEIMEYYKPTWLAYAGFGASVLASLSLPMFGFVLSKYIFVLSSFGDRGVTIDQYDRDRNLWSLTFVVLCLGIGSTAYL
jgi:hypothetical protein